PIVVGWEYHVTQRGHTQAEVFRRAADVETIYTSKDEKAVSEALKRNHVAVVYLGPLERKTYAGANLASFREWKNVLTPVYENPEVVIFAVKGAWTAGMPVTTIQPVLTPAGAGPVGAGAAESHQDPPGKFQQPRGAAFDAEGNAYVCDFVNNRIQKLDSNL